jgi:hypothetical protein
VRLQIASFPIEFRTPKPRLTRSGFLARIQRRAGIALFLGIEIVAVVPLEARIPDPVSCATCALVSCTQITSAFWDGSHSKKPLAQRNGYRSR